MTVPSTAGITLPPEGLRRNEPGLLLSIRAQNGTLKADKTPITTSAPAGGFSERVVTLERTRFHANLEGDYLRSVSHQTTKPPNRQSPGPEILIPRPETRNLKPETQNPNPKPETRKTKHTKTNTENRNPKHKTQNPKPETRNPKPETRNPKPET